MKPILKILPSTRLSNRRWKIKNKIRYINFFGEDYINLREGYLNFNRYKINKNLSPDIIEAFDEDICD